MTNSGTLRVLGLAGSPRRHGNTETLLDRLLAGAESGSARVEKIVVAEQRIADCVACDGCWDDGQCAIEDDYQWVAERILAADVVALAAPIYFSNVPAHVKALIDRSQALWSLKFVLHKALPPTAAGHHTRRGLFLATSGQSTPYFDGAVQTVRTFFRVCDTGLWNTLMIPGVDAYGAIEGHPGALEAAFDIGARAVREPWD